MGARTKYSYNIYNGEKRANVVLQPGLDIGPLKPTLLGAAFAAFATQDSLPLVSSATLKEAPSYSR